MKFRIFLCLYVIITVSRVFGQRDSIFRGFPPQSIFYDSGFFREADVVFSGDWRSYNFPFSFDVGGYKYQGGSFYRDYKIEFLRLGTNKKVEITKLINSKPIYVLYCNINYFELSYCDLPELFFKVDTLSILIEEANIHNIRMNYCEASTIKIEKLESKVFTIDRLNANDLFINNTNIGTLKINNSHFKSRIALENSQIENNSSISGTVNGLISLKGLKITGNSVLDIRGLVPASNKKASGNIPIDLYNCSVEKLHLDWRYFSLNPISDTSYETVVSTFQALLENFRKRGQLESLRKVDREYQSYRNKNIKFLGLGWLWDWIVYLWWDYGYGKWQVLLWMAFLPLFFAFIIRRKIWKLHTQVYAIENYNPYKDVPGKTSFIKSYLSSLTYVSIAFCMLSIKFEKLHYKNRGLLFLFIFIHLSGIFCLFFLVNFLLKV